MNNLKMRVLVAFLMLLVSGSVYATGVSTGRLYYSTVALVAVVSLRDAGNKLLITEYSRTYERNSRRYAILKRRFLLNLGSNDTGRLLRTGDGKDCGTWTVHRASEAVTLTKRGEHGGYRFLPTTESEVSKVITGTLIHVNNLDNEWVASGGVPTRRDRQSLGTFANVFNCR